MAYSSNTYCSFTPTTRNRCSGSTMYDFTIRIPDKYKMITFGYIRKEEKEFSLRAVPSLVKYLCLRYFFHDQHFSECTRGITILNRNRTVIRDISHVFDDPQRRNPEAIALVHPELPLQPIKGRHRHSICEWTFKMDRVDLWTTGSISIGMVQFAFASAPSRFSSVFDKIEFKAGRRDVVDGGG